MHGFEKYLEEQSLEFLKLCFYELEEFRNKGTFKNEADSHIKKLNSQFFGENSTMLHLIGGLIYREIARRHIEG